MIYRRESLIYPHGIFTICVLLLVLWVLDGKWRLRGMKSFVQGHTTHHEPWLLDSTIQKKSLNIGINYKAGFRDEVGLMLV